MKVGDPKKTAILAVIAVLAIGFCFKQLFGGGGEPKVLRQAAGASADGATPASGTLVATNLDQLRVDPFSHPRLAPKVPTGGAITQTPSGGTNPDGLGLKTGLVPDGPGELPRAYSPGLPIDKTPGRNWPDPVNPGEKPAGVEVKKVTQMTLKAIVKVNQRLAYISIDGQEPRAFRPGDLIKDDIQVAFVNDDSVIIKSSKATVTLRVGQQGDL
jgi:hypothetical protein